MVSENASQKPEEKRNLLSIINSSMKDFKKMGLLFGISSIMLTSAFALSKQTINYYEKWYNLFTTTEASALQSPEEYYNNNDNFAIVPPIDIGIDRNYSLLRIGQSSVNQQESTTDTQSVSNSQTIQSQISGSANVSANGPNIGFSNTTSRQNSSKNTSSISNGHLNSQEISTIAYQLNITVNINNNLNTNETIKNLIINVNYKNNNTGKEIPITSFDIKDITITKGFDRISQIYSKEINLSQKEYNSINNESAELEFSINPFLQDDFLNAVYSTLKKYFFKVEEYNNNSYEKGTYIIGNTTLKQALLSSLNNAIIFDGNTIKAKGEEKITLDCAYFLSQKISPDNTIKVILKNNKKTIDDILSREIDVSNPKNFVFQIEGSKQLEYRWNKNTGSIEAIIYSGIGQEGYQLNKTNLKILKWQWNKFLGFIPYYWPDKFKTTDVIDSQEMKNSIYIIVNGYDKEDEKYHLLKLNYNSKSNKIGLTDLLTFKNTPLGLGETDMAFTDNSKSLIALMQNKNGKDYYAYYNPEKNEFKRIELNLQTLNTLSQ